MTDEAFQIIDDMLEKCLFCGSPDFWILDKKGAYQCKTCSHQPAMFTPGPRSVFDIFFDPGDAYKGRCLYCQEIQRLTPIWATIIIWDQSERWAPAGEDESDFVMAPIRGYLCECGLIHFNDRGQFARISMEALSHHRTRLPQVPKSLPRPSGRVWPERPKGRI